MFLSSAPIAEAHHYIYRAEDPTKQDPDWQGVENGVFLKWATTISPMIYYAEPNLSDDVSVVFLNWYNAVPLGYQGTINPAEADLFFYEIQAPCGDASNDGCYDPYVESIYPRSYKSAGYFRMCGAPFFIRVPGTPPLGE